MGDLQQRSTDTSRPKFLVLRVAPSGHPPPGLIGRLLKWLRTWTAKLWPKDKPALDAAQDAIGKAIRAGEARLDEPHERVRKLKADTEHMLESARRTSVETDVAAATSGAEVSKRQAEAAAAWMNVALVEAQVKEKRADTLNKVIQGLKELQQLKQEGVDVTWIEGDVQGLLVSKKKTPGG